MHCPNCGSQALDSQRFCGSCGSLLAPPSELPTSAPAAVEGARSRSHPGAGGFTPGTLIAERYRIVSLLGRGGMGEVYRADDLQLGVGVALKFLPAALATDPDRRARLLAEVRLARQIAHPNVCRVFDIGDAGSAAPFLTMEYVDGEDLATLLRRIGRLPTDKALDVARQLCAGLAAAHARGVLHRDLKPANVMLDGRGRVRIMDFGVALNAESAVAGDIAGTPAYMAPEILAGGRASVASDIYALGLVLYELYTGKPAGPVASFTGPRARKTQEPPADLSELVADIDPAVERLIMRAIAREPGARPASVMHVAAALPGGSPVEAALKAGETPSPEMVAAIGTSERPSPVLVWALVALVIAGATAAIALGSTGLLWRFAVPDRSPDALLDRARGLLVKLGHSTPPVDDASAFEVELEQLRYFQRRSPSQWRSMRPDPSYLRFWYRGSPLPLEAWRFPFLYGNLSRITPADPPLDLAGMTLVRLDPQGRLTELVVVPPADQAAEAASAPDWSAVLAEAGYDPSAWSPASPRRRPPVYANARAAWEGTWPGSRDLPVRLEAAALNGALVYFTAVYPWTLPPRAPAPLLTTAERALFLSAIIIFTVTIACAVIVAQRNVRAGRGDRRGAFRLAVFVFATMVISWFFGESHVPTLWEVMLVVMALSLASLAAGVAWIAYLAVEPFLRRRWPAVLITWTRLLTGEFRDPAVGRDILVGCVAATFLAAIAVLAFLLPARLDVATDIVFVDVYGIVHGVQAVVPFLLWRAAQSVVAGLSGVLVLLVLRLGLGSQWTAAAVFTIAATALGGALTDNSWIEHASSGLHFGVFALLLVRFGLLAAVVQFYVWGLFVFFPMTTNLAAWYAGAGVTALLVVAALTTWGATAALGRPHAAAPH